MPKICAKCGDSFAINVWIDGARKNLQTRRYCLKCSPFGSHNTRRAGEKRRNELKGIVCCKCGKTLSDSQQKGRVCWNCYYAKRSAARLDAAYEIVGNACWRCRYTRGAAGRSVLDFHHVDPKEKSFNLDCRHIINMSSARVMAELKKCILLCANCHREVHAGLISKQEVARLHGEHWDELSEKVERVKLR